MLKMTEIELEKVSDIDKTCLLKNDSEEEFLTFLKDMLKQIINTWMIMTLKNRQHL